MSKSHSKSEQARINGAKSKGPTSIAGKAESSKNAVKHGFAATINVVLRVEDEPAFTLHLDGFRSSFHPQDYFESTLVDQLAAISWRQSRLVALETALIDAQVSIQSENLCAIYPGSADDEYFHLVEAWQALSRRPQKPDATEPHDPSLPPDGYDISSIELVRRYQVSLDRQFRNTLLNLRQYRKDFVAPPTAQPNEPNSVVPEPAPPQNDEAPLQIKIIPLGTRPTLPPAFSRSAPPPELDPNPPQPSRSPGGMVERETVRTIRPPLTHDVPR